MSRPGHHDRAASEGRRRVDAISLLLGEQAALDGPWSLLGISRGESSDRRITAALEARLMQINRHPLGGIPEADDVRLALHAAAAQVLNAHVRERLLSSTPDGFGRHLPGGPHAIDPILHAIAMHGGVNERSIRRIMLITPGADGRREIASRIHDRLVAWSHGRRVLAGPVSPPTHPERGRLVSPEILAVTHPGHPYPATPTDNNRDPEIDPGVRAVRSALIVITCVIAAATVVVIGVLAMLRPPGPSEAWIPKADSSTPGRTSATELFPANPPRADAQAQDKTPPRAPATPPTDASDPVGLVREVAAAASSVQADGEASLERFLAASRSLSTRWHLLPADQLGACQDAIVEFLYRSTTIEIARSALEATLDVEHTGPWTPGALLADVWRAGILARLTRERDLPAAVRELIDSARDDNPGRRTPNTGSFSRGALDRLAWLPDQLAAQSVPEGSPDAARGLSAAWAAWRDACRLVCGADATAFDRLMITGLEAVLESGTVPAVSRGLGGVLKDLTLSVSWRSGGIARPWLIASFTSPSILDPDLEVITRALATESAADGVTPTMVLPAHPDEKARMSLREAFASAWGLSDPGRKDALIEHWITRAQAAATTVAIDRRADEHHVASLEMAVIRARIGLAAAMIWAGLFDDAQAIISDSSASGISAAPSSGQSWSGRSLDDGASDGSWAVRYLAAEHRVPQRLALLTELAGSDRPIGQLDAEVLVAEAIRGTPESVRSAARDALDRWVTTPPALYALLEESYRIPRTRQNAALVGSVTLVRLPPLNDPAWYASVRRALVDRLLEALSAAGPLRAIDLLSDELTLACVARARPSDASRSAGADSLDRSADTRTPQNAIQDLLAVWRRAAETLIPTGREPLTREQVERRLAARSSSAAGPVQQFAATHLAVAEFMAVVVANERPSRSADVLAILDQLAADRRSAPHVFDQVNAAELAMMKLWKVRFEGGTS
ncbi:MAG: hypothetical protein KF787_09060 [Phycisphaeraceae bacterium]|nr:hypothetical protein [Phycisphaerae bacterium]MBX3392782.1 hypothetical protein [Phycisphaeraceae bacterium]